MGNINLTYPAECYDLLAVLRHAISMGGTIDVEDAESANCECSRIQMKRIHILLGCRLARLLPATATAPTNHEAIGCLSVFETWGMTEGIAFDCK